MISSSLNGSVLTIKTDGSKKELTEIGNQLLLMANQGVPAGRNLEVIFNNIQIQFITTNRELHMFGQALICVAKTNLVSMLDQNLKYLMEKIKEDEKEPVEVMH